MPLRHRYLVCASVLALTALILPACAATLTIPAEINVTCEWVATNNMATPKEGTLYLRCRQRQVPTIADASDAPDPLIATEEPPR